MIKSYARLMDVDETDHPQARLLPKKSNPNLRPIICSICSFSSSCFPHRGKGACQVASGLFINQPLNFHQLATAQSDFCTSLYHQSSKRLGKNTRGSLFTTMLLVCFVATTFRRALGAMATSGVTITSKCGTGGGPVPNPALQVEEKSLSSHQSTNLSGLMPIMIICIDGNSKSPNLQRQIGRK